MAGEFLPACFDMKNIDILKPFLISLFVVSGVSFFFVFSANAYVGNNYSNGSATTGVIATSTEDIRIYSATIETCKQYNNDNGEFWLNIYDQTDGEYIATSTIEGMENLVYSWPDCLFGHTYEFPFGVNLETDHVYQYQMHRTDNSIFYNYDYFGVYNDYLYSASKLTANYYGSLPINYTYQPPYLELSEVAEYTVEVIEYPWQDGEVYISSENFDFPETIRCQVATSCPIKIYYSIEDIGSELFFLEADETELSNYIDYIAELEDKPLLYDYVYPTIRATETTDMYQYFVYNSGGTASSSLYQYTKVFWVEELTEEYENANAIDRLFGRLKNIFPLSLYFQIYDIIDDVKNNEADEDYLNITIGDFLPEEYEDLVSSTSPIISHNLISDNLDIWDTHIFPTLEYFVYTMNFIFIIFLLLPKKQTET